MIGWLSGKLRHRESGRCILDVGGVGYEVHATERALEAWSQASDTPEAFVSTQVREDAITLYGFESSEERQAFETLLAVSGVGPKVALATLGALDVPTLAQAIEAGDLASLARVKGVGKKTAQRMVLELKGKLAVPFTPTPTPRPAKEDAEPERALDLALERLGYSAQEVQRAHKLLAEQGLGPDAPVADRLRTALRLLYTS